MSPDGCHKNPGGGKKTAVDQGARYLELCRLGRDAFLEGAAPAALVRESGSLSSRSVTDSDDREAETTLVSGFDVVARPGSQPAVSVFPLAKKPGAPFSEMITVGRTGNNDVVLNDVTVSRFHAYFKGSGGSWFVCDSGSKNGTRVDGERLDARKETRLTAGAHVRFGDVEGVFYPAAELYDFLVAVG